MFGMFPFGAPYFGDGPGGTAVPPGLGSSEDKIQIGLDELFLTNIMIVGSVSEMNLN